MSRTWWGLVTGVDPKGSNGEPFGSYINVIPATQRVVFNPLGHEPFDLAFKLMVEKIVVEHQAELLRLKDLSITNRQGFYGSLREGG